MNVLVVCQHYWPEPFNVEETCELLKKSGHNVTVVTGYPNYPDGVIYEGYSGGKKSREHRNGVAIRRARIVSRGADLKGLNKLKRVANYLSFVITASSKAIVRDVDYDVVLCVQYSPVLMAIPALKHARRKGKPCLIYVYDLWPEDLLTGGMSREGMPYKLMKVVSRRIYSRADTLAITSPGFEEYFKTELGISNARYVYIPQYAENQFVALGQEERQHPEQKDGVDIVFAGNVGGNQGIENVVEAAALMRDRSDIRIHIVGSGSRLEYCKELAQSSGLHNVIFHGRQPLSAMPEYYRMADAMLLPLSNPGNGSLVSKYTIPRKLQSYLAAGKPVLVFADGTIAEMARNYEFGLCSAPNDPRSMADTMLRFADMSHEQRMRLAENSKSTYEREFTKDLFLSRLENALKELA